MGETELQNVQNQFIPIQINPLAIFKMIWRLAQKYPEVKNSCESSEMSRIATQFEYNLNILLPTELDLEEAVEGIIRVQFACQLDTHSV